MKKRLILIAGNIGSGKTSLAERLGQRLNWQAGFESVSDNPYLPDFYQDMAAWSFHLQVFFLGHRALQHQEAADNPRSAILDRSIYEDFHIFSRALHHLGNLNERDFLAYQRVYELVVDGLPAPDLLLYLKTPVEVLMGRIQKRGRAIESGIDAAYLSLLDTFYNEWLQVFDLCPVLTIQSDDLDFVHKPHHLNIVIERINERLIGKEDIILPAD